MKRFAAMQLCPQLRKREATPTDAACLRSASGRTMKASEPPSSSTDFLRFVPSGRRHLFPGRVAARERHRVNARIGDDLFRLRGRNHKCAEYAFGEAGFVENLFDGESALRDVRGVFQHRGVARHETWRGEAEHLPEREVPC